MNNLNSVLIEGVSGSYPIITVSKKGSPVCTFTLISKRIFKQDNTFKEDTIEITIEAWASIADLCREHCIKGCGVRVVGRLKQNKADGKIVVIAENIVFNSKTRN